MSDRQLRISLFAHPRATAPDHCEMSFDELAGFLERHAGVYASKDAAPLWSPAEYEEGAARSAAGVRRVHVGAVDLDDVPLLDVQRVVGASLHGLSAIVHSTWQHHIAHAAGRVRARVLVELSRPVLPGPEWSEFWRRLAAYIGIPVRRKQGADGAAKDCSRMFFVPAAPLEGQAARLWFRLHGEPLDVDRLLERDWRRLSAPRATLDTLGSLAARLERSRRAASLDLAPRVRALAAGQRYAGPGERDDATWNLACRLARECPGASEFELALVFARSLQVMNAEDASDPYPLDEIPKKIARARSQEPEGEDDADTVRRRWRECLIRSGRPAPYSDDDLARLCESLGVERGRLDQCWVLQHGHGYWLLGERGECAWYHGPFVAASVSERAEVELAPADPAGVICQVRGTKRLTRKSAADLVADHGMVLDEVIRDLAAQSPTLDLDRRTLRVPACPLRLDLVAERHPEVEEWLALLGGSELEILLDWIACVTRLAQPCAALYLEGAPGAGKSLLPAGLARLWTTGGPSDLDDALGSDWNDPLLACPLVFGDETIPRDRSGRPLTEELRKLIAAYRRTLRIRYQSAQQLHGAVRVVLAANNRGMLSGLGDLTGADVEAICKRLIFIPVSDDASRYLERLGGPSVIQDWVERDLIAQHALWLRETRAVADGGRFLVEGKPGPLVRSMVTSSGLRASVCHWLVQWLLDRSDLAAIGAEHALAVRDGQLEVAARALHERWDSYPTSDLRRPTISRLAAALRGMARGQVERVVGGQTVRHDVIDLRALAEWSAEHGFASIEDLQAAVARRSTHTTRAA